jgi:copper chaperone CopZ
MGTRADSQRVTGSTVWRSLLSTTTTRLATTGLHCRSCSMLVDMTVGDLDGVSDVSTDHASGETVVTFDTDVLDVESIIGAIRSVGYDAEVAD